MDADFVLQLPSEGGMDGPPLDIGKYLWRILYRNTALPGTPPISLGDVERLIRQKLT